MNPDSTKYLERYLYLWYRIHESDIVGNSMIKVTQEDRDEIKEKGKTIKLALDNYFG